MAKNIIFSHPDGTLFAIRKRHECTFISSCEQTVDSVNEDCVDMVIPSAVPVDFRIGDKVIIFGRPYWLNQPAKIMRSGKDKYEYSLHMEGIQYQLARAAYNVNIDTTGSDLQSDSLTADLLRFVEVLAANANRVVPGMFAIGEIPKGTEVKTLIFGDTDNCLSVLQRLCQEYKTDFLLSPIDPEHFTINIGVKGRVFPYKFEFGRGRGIFQLIREKTSDANIVNRLMVYGSTRNITSKYRSTRLLLPGRKKSNSFIEDAASIKRFGIWENAKTFEDIYPSRTGHVTSIESGTLNEFFDLTMDFDLNEKEPDGKTTKWLIPGTAAKIHFNTGGLAGMEFDVSSYDHKTKKIRFKSFTDENGFTFPSESSAAFRVNEGDEYVFLDINLPDTYVANAEKRLSEAGDQYIKQHSTPAVKYSLSISRMFIQSLMSVNTESDVFWPGDMVKIKDAEIGVDREIRVTGFKRDVLNPCDYDLTIADGEYQRTITDRVINDVIHFDRIVQVNRLNDPAKARRNWRDAQELMNMVFDPEGSYYSERIKPESIETVMMSVGAKSMQFGLEGIVFEPNFGGLFNQINVSDGALVHYTIDEEAARRWQISGVRNATLTGAAPGKTTDATSFYIYARCEVSGSNGSIIFSPEPKAFNEDPLYYHFWIGVLNSVDPGLKARSLSLTYGFTTVNGRFIKTGVIMSADGETYFDLDNSEIGGRIVFTENGKKKTIEELAIEAEEAKDYINNTLPGVLDNIYAQLDGQIEQFFYEVDPSLTTAPANDWTTTSLKENHLGDLYYNTKTGKVWRWIKNGDGSYQWSLLQDSEVANALAIANDALKLAKEKRRIFTSEPYTPYESGDLWVQGVAGDIMRCVSSRANGKFTASDWEKASNYTDDTELKNFINGAYTDMIADLSDQIDGKIESFFQNNDPASTWTDRKTRISHSGDTWYDSSDNVLRFFVRSRSVDLTYYIENGGHFYSSESDPTPSNYPENQWTDKKSHVGDLYFNRKEKTLFQYDGFIDIATHVIKTRWSKVDDENVVYIAAELVRNLILQDGISMFIEQPEKYRPNDIYFRNGIIMQSTVNNTTFDESNWRKYADDWYVWQRSFDKDALAAFNKAANAQATADGKRRTFLVQPEPPYDIGDLWIDGKDLRMCRNPKPAKGVYESEDWVIGVNYDNTKTVIDGGIITSGTIQLAGSDGSILAGITGSGSASNAVRIWAGSTYANRASAPFRVLQDGSSYMKNATVEGLVRTSDSGERIEMDPKKRSLIVYNQENQIIARLYAQNLLDARFGCLELKMSTNVSDRLYMNPTALQIDGAGFNGMPQRTLVQAGSIDMKDMMNSNGASMTLNGFGIWNTNGTKSDGVTWDKIEESPDLTRHRLIVKGGIIVGYF